MIDYEILKVLWWVFIGVLLVGFAVMDGQDMGVGTLLPFLSKEDSERRIMINSVAPHWDGNQVWLLTGGGAMFAAWPLMYATAFSGFYWAMLIVLFVLIFRPVAFDYRSKVPSTKWRTNWDWLLFLGSAVPPIIFGVAFGNLLQGVPFEIDATMRPVYTGSFFGLLNPFGLLCGVLSLAMIVAHGANYLVLRTEGTLQEKARKVGSVAAFLAFVLFLLGGVWVYLGIDGYVAVSGLDPAGPANPQDGGNPRRRLVRQLRRLPGPLGPSGARSSRHARFGRSRAQGRRGQGDRRLGRRDARHHPHAAWRHVPLRDALLGDAQRRPHPLGLHELAADARGHVLRDAHPPAARSVLHGLGVQGHERQAHGRVHRKEHALALLTFSARNGAAPRFAQRIKGISMAYFYWIAVLGFAILLAVTLETIAAKNEEAK